MCIDKHIVAEKDDYVSSQKGRQFLDNIQGCRDLFIRQYKY